LAQVCSSKDFSVPFCCCLRFMPEIPAHPGVETAPVQEKKKRKRNEEKEFKEIRFRNYTPRTAELRAFCLPRITSTEIEEAIDKEVKAVLAEAEDQDVALAIAPRKPNWDLKRDVEKKMQVLQARTDRAVVALIRQRIIEDKAKAPSKTDSAGNPEDEKGGADEASLMLAREVARAPGTEKSGAMSDDEA